MTALRRRNRWAAELRALDPDRPDGRKTPRKRAPKTPPHLLPEYVLTFEVGERLLPLMTEQGPSGITGVLVGPRGKVEARGKDPAWVRQQAQAYLGMIGAPPVSATARRGKRWAGAHTLHPMPTKTKAWPFK